MSKYKAGDKFIVEVGEVFEETGIDVFQDELYRIKGFRSLVFDDNGLDKLQKYEDKDYAEGVKEGLASLDCEVKKAYEKGLQDVWELVNKIKEMSRSQQRECFNVSEDIMDAECTIFAAFTPQEALAKMEAYEQEKEIKVGDVVQPEKGVEFIVTHISSDSHLFGICASGDTYTALPMRYCKKTGKHIDIQQILDGIGKE